MGVYWNWNFFFLFLVCQVGQQYEVLCEEISCIFNFVTTDIKLSQNHRLGPPGMLQLFEMTKAPCNKAFRDYGRCLSGSTGSSCNSACILLNMLE